MSAELLGRLCALDFHPGQFPDSSARQTSVAKTTQLIIRDDLDDGRVLSYSVVGARSLGAYLWEAILDSGRDLDIRPLGAHDL
jgi:sarcosine oxidase gamma subunit